MKRTIIDASNLELRDNVVSIKRVTKVVKGGRNMRFAALVVVGDGNGHVGAGVGKAAEVPEAIRKGKEDAIKHLVEVPMDENSSVPHDFIGKFGGATVFLRSSRRYWYHRRWSSSFQYLNLQVLRISVQSHLVLITSRMAVLATIEGLKVYEDSREVARLRGKSVSEILG